MEIKVLHIDDDYNYSNILKDVLGEHNINIMCLVDNVDDAIKEVLNNNFDIILVDMDINNNEYAGIEITKIISKFTDAYILILTGSCLKNEIIYIAHEVGACGYELKTYINKLSYVIKEIINGGYTPIMYARQVKIEKLNREQKEIIVDLQNNLSYSQISKKHNKSYESIRKQIDRMKINIGKMWANIIDKK